MQQAGQIPATLMPDTPQVVKETISYGSNWGFGWWLGIYNVKLSISYILYRPFKGTIFKRKCAFLKRYTIKDFKNFMAEFDFIAIFGTLRILNILVYISYR